MNPELPRFSASKVKTFMTCPMQYKLHYLDKVPGFETESQSALNIGTAVHKTLELLAENPKEMDKWRNGEAVDVDAIFKSDGPISLAEQVEAKDILRGFFSWRKPPKLIVGTEVEIDGGVGGYVFKGYIDRMDSISANHLSLVDYKSGAHIYDKDEVVSDPQTLIYVMWAWESYLNREASIIDFTYDFVRFQYGEIRIRFNLTDEEVPTPPEYILVSKDEFLEAWNHLTATMDAISNEKSFEPRLSRLCSYCQMSRYCKAYSDAVMCPEIKDVMPDDVDGLIAEQIRLNALKGIIEKHLKDINTVIRSKLAAGQEPEKYVAHPVTRTTSYRPVELVVQLLPPDLLAQVVTISEERLAKAKIPPELRARIDAETGKTTALSYYKYRGK